MKHPSFQGWRFALVQLLTAEGGNDGEPLLMLDPVGANAGSTVIASNDGARKLAGSKTSPARWFVMGLQDA